MQHTFGIFRRWWLAGLWAAIVATLPWAEYAPPLSAQDDAQPTAAAEGEDAEEEEEEEEELPLFEQEPYDVIYVDTGESVKVFPIPQEAPGPIERPKKKSAVLRVKLFDEPEDETEYEVPWTKIERIERFIDLVVAKTLELIKTDRPDEAYIYVEWLRMFHMDWPGAPEAIQEYLLDDAKRWLAKGDSEFALAMFSELYTVNSKHPALSKGMGNATQLLFDRALEAEDYKSARRRVRHLAKLYPKHPVAVAGLKHLGDLTKKHVEQSKVFRTDGKLVEAYAEVFEGLRILPSDPAARKLATDILKEFPRVTVGVTLPGSVPDQSRLAVWPVRRTWRLTHRPLMEFTDFGPQGGIYRCPFGTDPEKLDLDTRLIFRLNAGIHWSGSQAPLTGLDVAHTLLSMANRQHPAYRPDWAGVFSSVRVHGVYEVEVELRKPHILPEAILDQDLLRYAPGEETAEPSTLAPYAAKVGSAGKQIFEMHEGYYAKGTGQPREVTEVYFPDSAEAIKALKKGEIMAIDRLNPWEIADLAKDERFTIGKYGAPTTHALLVNPAKKYMANRSFRRGLLYGINRRLILEQQILKGLPDGLNQVATGVFPQGDGPDDPRGAATNPDVSGRSYQPRLAMTLATYAVREIDPPKPSAEQLVLPEDERQLPPVDLKTSVPPLILAHPPHELARVCCRAIKRQWELLGLRVELVETSPEAPATPPAEWDLLFVELGMWEPLVDARRLLAAEGLAGMCSSFMEFALRQLDESPNWRAARERIFEVHRQAHDDCTVLPLWQLEESFVHHKLINGVGKHPVTLYHQIEQWKLSPWFPEE